MDIKYVLFTHFPNVNAWKALEDNVSAIADHINGKATSGMLVVFFDAGWISLLNTIGTDFDPGKMAEEFQSINAKEALIESLISQEPRLKGRLRLVTAKTLFPIINNLRGNKPGLAATQLRRYLVSDVPGVRYDTTKVVEAIIRVRHLGSGIPVLRMDWDALLNKRTLTSLLQVIIRDIPRESADLIKDARIRAFMISGNYESPRTPRANWTINEFNAAFATRIFPALVPTADVCTQLDTISEEVEKKVDGKVVKVNGMVVMVRKDRDLSELSLVSLGNDGLFDRELMLRYYGLDGSTPARLGSDPEKSVISGAGLVLSDGAILDLPPFSNFQQNVMWIDDYLKYELHRALGHFSEISKGSGIPGRVEETAAFKDRVLAGQGNLRPYTLGEYIPTLFWGLLGDVWIKGKGEALSATDNKSPFVEALKCALRRGVFEPNERAQLIEDLNRDALDRVNKVRETWGKLKTHHGTKSFAALWVGGSRPEIKTVMGTLTPPNDDWLGYGLLEDPTQDSITTLEQLRKPIRKIVKQLQEDMCTYIDWALEWPKFIQSVRAVPNGSLIIDIDYSK